MAFKWLAKIVTAPVKGVVAVVKAASPVVKVALPIPPPNVVYHMS